MKLVLDNNTNGFIPVGMVYELLPEQAPLFRAIGGNRSIKSSNVRRILKNFLENGYLISPIIVNEKFQVIDGQHRIEAWVQICEKYPERKFNLLFIVAPGYTIKDAQKLNAIPPKKWTVQDYIESYRTDNENYQMIYDFMEKYGIGAISSTLLLSGKIHRLSSEDYQDFRNGQFVIDPANVESANQIADTIVNKLNAFPMHSSDRFISAFMRLYTMPKFDEVRFMTNWDYFWKDELAGRNSETSLFHGLVEIHNGKVTKGRISTTKRKKVELATEEA